MEFLITFLFVYDSMRVFLKLFVRGGGEILTAYAPTCLGPPLITQCKPFHVERNHSRYVTLDIL